MQRPQPAKRRRVRVRSQSPVPVHYIDLTADSPLSTTTTTTTTTATLTVVAETAAPTRRRLTYNGNVKSSSSNDANNRPVTPQQLETISIPESPETQSRSRIPRRLTTNKSPSKPVIILSNDEKNNEADLGERIPAINDSLDGITPTVLSCPICYEDLRSSRKPMTTKCGHLFCESCIQATLSSRKKCPVCMASITIKSCIRVHF